MPVLLDGRPGELDAIFAPGFPFVVTLTGPAGWLDDRTFSATLGGLTVPVVEDGDDLVLTVSAVTTAAVQRLAHFSLRVGGIPVLVGDWVARDDGSDHGSLEASVIIDALTVAVTILGPTGTGGGGVGGGQVDQVVEATGIDVDASDPAAPVISAAPAIALAATDATTKANAAQAAAISSAATDATTKANAAQAAAIATAATDATTKANAAQSAATAAAGTDATTKANAAQAAAISAASTDATTKANAAQAAAVQRANHTGTQAIATVTGLQTALDAAATDSDIATAVDAIPELVAADPAELNLSTVGAVTTATLTAEIARQDDLDTTTTTANAAAFNVAAAAALINAQRPKIVGEYMFPVPGPTGTSAMVLNRLMFFPAWLREGTLDRIGVEVAATVATAVVRLGVYADSSGRPGALIAEATGTVDAGASTGWKELTISAVLPSIGRYHLAAVSQTAAANLRIVLARDPLAPVAGHGTSLPGSTGGTHLGTHVSAAGALPNPAGTVGYGQTAWPQFVLRYSA